MPRGCRAAQVRGTSHEVGVMAVIDEKLLSGSMIYKKYLGDGDDGEAVFISLTLDGVFVREKFSFGEDGDDVGGVIVYFFPEISTCRDGRGRLIDFPIPENGDLCLWGMRELRVSEMSWHSNGGILSHVRLVLS